MRFQATVLAVAATFAFASAQDLSQVPQCAIPCFVSALPASKCGTTDIKCQCTTGREPLQEALMACVPTKCSQEDALKIIPAVSGLCASAGITLSDIPTAAPAATGTPAASPSGNQQSGVPASATPSGSKPTVSSTSSGSPAQSTGAASGNSAAVGAIALGLAAAAFGL
ncbi:hypothetical protein COCC4DRAFT_72358 [Bipolaris maydis ATCC 48331]|uniref:CFEM domain-containing protein n=2 Tax=Cochliobolus heterostrophus TaxID=5016 RepID=M2UM24_COCH5|nr:uncharacterized protein COCC4DRAFT_72358 [Bipolaris maydis ATCC 48331]EMD89003.1 hypothetical protein COCHEDRAFT_1140702 [Bipolaris maydis C5]KAH7552388.1 hypothetical protein BM1_08339 [Bipolaris maydis]ENI05278.1 hypothetical protein COCC4DRAFT_72358 [Bipolaris maydis ATCC 48331]KAJ5024687.1 hypothetical protein J3E73DRAFT_321565 [Bipolaris maydis]KAJ5056893.1 hypothetical protein J3E74DRAFT_467798 [Bipolaris maydis]